VHVRDGFVRPSGATRIEAGATGGFLLSLIAVLGTAALTPAPFGHLALATVPAPVGTVVGTVLFFVGFRAPRRS
jgi:hypothetical protein